ncbi:Aldehyde/histidinol dehydrogenase [Infundibulicybe gibba]|nr:Aldehyde/histidinol dehydrogenase [Infundibulicybe gibba]
MSSLVSLILHPLITLGLAEDDDEAGIDVFYLISLFFAFGIWLVFERYQKAHNSAVPFHWVPPAPADPFWESFPIENAHLESHLEHPEVSPPMRIEGRRYITSFDPATSLHIGTYLADDEEDINRKIQAAAEAQKKWKETTFTQRRRVMRSLLKWLVDNQDVCARVACRDSGKTFVDAALGEILTTCSKLEWLIQHGEKALRPESRRGNLMMMYKKSQVRYEPLGVVAGIVSWNYPLHNAWSPILASIFSGNAIVLKCSENVLWSTNWFVGAITECLRVLKHDPELVQVVCCWPEQADALTKSPVIKHITFIGSETVGRKIAVAATEHLTPVTLELGGKDPAIILPRTDLNKWISLWMRGILKELYRHERLIVHNSQYDELHEMISDREGYVQTVDCGSMISGHRFQSLQGIIQDAKDRGADISGGEQYDHSYFENGYYFKPSVLLFAPVAVLMPYKDVPEAIEIANGTRYGLGASVFGPDQNQCLKVARQLECGMVSVNDFGVFYDLPFGGVKSSGYGRFGGPEGLRSLTNVKAVIVDRWPSLIQTSIPKVLDYPIRSMTKSREFCNGLVRFLYADGWRTRFRGLMAVIKATKE